MSAGDDPTPRPEEDERARPPEPASGAPGTGENGDLALVEPPPQRRRRLWRLLALLVVIGIGGAIWAYTPLTRFSEAEAWLNLLQTMRGTPWTPAILVLAFVAAGFAMFPISILVSLSGMLFGPTLGFIYALIGSVISALVLFALGRLYGRPLVERLGGPRAVALSDRLRRHGFISVTLLAMMPVAPFTIYNLGAGASRVRLHHFIGGTAIGMSPAMLALVIFGEGLTRLVTHPDVTSALLVLAAVALVGVIGFAANAWYLRRRRARRQAERLLQQQAAGGGEP
ncbi:MAG: TVP38/TMEM64 family protein [Rhodovibrionaceae bacterium]|nr:TVP38/TMEM64 family protein [Rhodovibrionaceae bacterium]